MKNKIREWLQRFIVFLKDHAEEILVFAGFLCILIGTYQLWPKATWFVCGAEFLLSAVIVALGSKTS